MKFFSKALYSLSLSLICACASSLPKTEPVLSEYEGKKIALVEVTGKPTAQRVVEDALVNQLVEKGTFILLNKKEVEAARTQYNVDPRDWKAIATKSGADLALFADVVEFEAEERQGYSSEKKYDTLLAAERGEENAEAKRYYKVKSLDGNVQVELRFVDLQSGEERKGVAWAKDQMIQEEKDRAIQLPPKLRYLESLANKAFRRFFVDYE